MPTLQWGFQGIPFSLTFISRVMIREYPQIFSKVLLDVFVIKADLGEVVSRFIGYIIYAEWFNAGASQDVLSYRR